MGFKEGAEAIKKHKFFEGINWNDLLNKKIKAPVTFTEDLTSEYKDLFINNNGFENWNSWHLNMESPNVKKTKESKGHFEGFTFENEMEYEFEASTPTPEPKH